MLRVRNKWLALALFVIVCFGAAAIGRTFTTSSVDSWYHALTKPAWNPPDWAFPPVWTLLYTSMAVAAWLVWRKGSGRKTKLALSLFFVQLVLNAAWSALFFGMRDPGLAFVELAFLWLAILLTVVFFYRVRFMAALIMMPYFIWVTFAGALNYAIWQLNA